MGFHRHDSKQLIAELFQVMYWIARRYARNQDDLPAEGLAFDPALIPHPLSAEVRQQKQADLRAQAEAFAQQQKELAAAREKAENLDAEIIRLRAEIKRAKAANAVRPDTHDYREAETRKYIIDVLLREAGWKLDQPQDREYHVTGMPTEVAPSGEGKVDYVLWDDNGRPLALVEAKRTTRDETRGQHQAKLYADCLERIHGQRPVIFYTNGYKTQIWDDTFYPPREIQGFYRKDELRRLIERRAGRQRLTTAPINEEIVERNYQARAIRRVGEAFETRQRQALVVMATGAGKTRTVIALVDQLVNAGWVKRTLFLADRQALVKQATNAFKTHLPGMPTVNLLKEKEQTARVYVSTYPTMMSLINGTIDDERKFGPGYFDLVIVDEAHRSIYQKYKALFDYFDSLLVGLTATPKDEIDRNTYRMFGLEDGVPTDVYELDEAVADGYLVAPRAVDVPLKFVREGIRYDHLSEEDKDAWDAVEWDDDGDVPDFVPPEDVNKYLFNADTIDLTLKTLMTHGLKVAGGDRLGKTIVFAQNKKHADFIVERFNACYPEHQGDFAQVIVHGNDFAQDLIDKFSDKDKAPHIAVSVDMLDTGIDVPEVVNLVFAKMVRSKTKFWQMIGRGTRLCADLFGPGQNKLGFLVFDLCRNVEFFNQDIPRAEGRLQSSLSERIFRHRADLLLSLDQRQPAITPPEDGAPDGTKSEEGLRWDLATRLQVEVAGMDPRNIEVRVHLQEVERYADPITWRLPVTQERYAEVTEHLAALPTAFTEEENTEEAKRFDLLTLRLQLAVLNGDPGFDRLRAQVQEIASALLDQTTIPSVAAQQALLDELTTDEWWQDVTLPMLETMRRRIRRLVKLIERIRRGVVYTDFEDELGDITLRVSVLNRGAADPALAPGPF
jgi:type I restriction enzyme, R subunit